MKKEGYKHHPYHSLLRRAVYSVILVGSVMLVGTLGFHYIEHYSYVDSFYFVSMLATAEGPASTPVTGFGKIFASLIAFFSIGTVIFATAFLLGPFLGKLIKIGEEKFEEEKKRAAEELEKIEKRI
jgi:hypothetical protein